MWAPRRASLLLGVVAVAAILVAFAVGPVDDPTRPNGESGAGVALPDAPDGDRTAGAASNDDDVATSADDPPRSSCRDENGDDAGCVRWQRDSPQLDTALVQAVGGHLVVAHPAGGTLGVDAASGRQTWTLRDHRYVEAMLDPVGEVVPLVTSDGAEISGVDAGSGVERWHHEAEADRSRRTLASGPQGVTVDAGSSVALLDARSGEVLASRDLEPGDTLRSTRAGLLLLTDDGIQRLDPDTLHTHWRQRADETHLLHADAHRVVLVDDSGRALAVAADTGEHQWRSSALGNPASRQGTRGNADVIVTNVTSPRPEMVAIDAETGRERWRYQFRHASATRSAAAVAGGRVHVVEPRPFPALVALDAVTGEVVWTAGTDHLVRTDRLARHDDLLVAPTDEDVVVLDDDDGETRFVLDVPEARVLDADELVVTGDRRIVGIDPDPAAPDPDPTPHPKPTSGGWYLP